MKFSTPVKQSQNGEIPFDMAQKPKTEIEDDDSDDGDCEDVPDEQESKPEEKESYDEVSTPVEQEQVKPKLVKIGDGSFYSLKSASPALPERSSAALMTRINDAFKAKQFSPKKTASENPMNLSNSEPMSMSGRKSPNLRYQMFERATFSPSYTKQAKP